MADNLARPVEPGDRGRPLPAAPDSPGDRLASVGRIFYALPMVAFGAMNLLWRGFVTSMVPPWPAWIPGQPFWACLVGVVLIAIGAAILFEVKVRLAAATLGTMMLLSVALLFVPRVAPKAGVLIEYTGPSEFIVLAAGAFLIARLAAERGRAGAGPISTAGRASADPTLPVRVLFAALLVLCGIDHFIYTTFVAALVPAWIPHHVFWTYFAGVALIAGGLGMLVEKTRVPAALLTGVMLFTWCVILHTPRALAAPHDTMEWSSVWESLAFAGLAFLLAATPSPAVERRGRGASSVFAEAPTAAE